MTTPEFFVTPGFGEYALANLRYSQAVRIGNRVDISGQGGWDDEVNFPTELREEIIAAFDNVERTLAAAGATWRDVISVDSFHVTDHPTTIGDAHNSVMVEQFHARMGDRAPIWTQIAVPALGAPDMRIEIKVSAIVGAT